MKCEHHHFDHLRFCIHCTLSAEQVYSGRPPSPAMSDTRTRDRQTKIKETK